MPEENDSPFLKSTFNIHKSILKQLVEISKIYKISGTNKITKQGHVSIAISLYADMLRKKKIKPGDNIAAKLAK